MPLTVITLQKVPPSLRGDLTQWMQEISTGVYVGNFSTRIREFLWKRVCDSAETGMCTMSYACRNEIGYQFLTHNSDRSVMDSDGIPLVLWPTKKKEEEKNLKRGFSTAYKYHKIQQRTAIRSRSKETVINEEPKSEKQYVYLDIETTGLNPEADSIIEIGALSPSENSVEEFHRFIHIQAPLPKNIVQLTGITDEMLQEGVDEETALCDLLLFLNQKTIVGYHVEFDLNFINVSLRRQGKSPLSNQVLDLIEVVKKERLFQSNYRLTTSLKAYGINEEVPHRALEDVKLLYRLAGKLKIY